MTASLILTNDEWNYALTGQGNPGELEEKGLLYSDDNDIPKLGRELELIVDEYHKTVADIIDSETIAVRGARFCILIEPYRLMSNTIKISLHKDATALQDALTERSNLQNERILPDDE